MPPRTSRPRSSSAPQPASHADASMKHSLSTHATSITILWILIMALSISVWLVLLFNMVRMDRAEENLVMLSQEIGQVKLMVAQSKPTPVAPSPIAIPATTVPPTQEVPPVQSSLAMSPSGALDRGSMSADGTKYAGYEDVVKGKIGIGVEIVATKQVKHIVIFNPNSETTGKDTLQEATMSVRWTDANTIEYDILVKKNGEWVKQVQTVKIYF